MDIKEILTNLQENQISIEDAEKAIKNNQYEDLGYAKIDLIIEKKDLERAKWFFAKENLTNF